MDALLIGPALALSFGATLFAGKALLQLVIAGMQRAQIPRAPCMPPNNSYRQPER
jgi:hypothetical protein